MPLNPTLAKRTSDTANRAGPLVAPLPAKAAGAAAKAALAHTTVTSSQMQLSRRIGRGCRAELGGGVSVWLAPDSQGKVDWSTSFSTFGNFGVIEFAEGRLLTTVTGIDLDAERNSDDEIWNWVQSGALARFQGTPFAAVDCIKREPQEISEDACTLCCSLHLGGEVLETHARARPETWLKFLQGSSWTRERVAEADYADLVHSVPVRVARHTLPVSALATLTPGDFIIPDAPFFTHSGTGTFQWKTLRARVRFVAPDALQFETVEAKLSTSEMEDGSAMAEEQYEEQPMDVEEGQAHVHAEGIEPAALENVPVTLDFELGKLRLSLGDLRTIGPDVILPLQDASPESISILCGGRLLGRGEVVSVNDQLAVRILEWSASS